MPDPNQSCQDIQPVAIPRALLEAAFREARASFPSECCGWLSGPRAGNSATQIHPCVNDQDSGNHPIVADRTAERAYVFGPRDLLELNRTLDDDCPPLVIYHSHPNGQAYFSPTDRQVAASPWGDGPAYPVQQLVVGIDERRVVEAALFAWSDDEAGFVEIARYEGADI
ncbi:MAG: Mov34/MPN/PAD-1 family protein [Chloroflexota bacterium]|nr:Mov34/MPN/PAD-1 family protein [Chloroflexota bacterium]